MMTSREIGLYLEHWVFQQYELSQTVREEEAKKKREYGSLTAFLLYESPPSTTDVCSPSTRANVYIGGSGEGKRSDQSYIHTCMYTYIHHLYFTSDLQE